MSAATSSQASRFSRLSSTVVDGVLVQDPAQRVLGELTQFAHWSTILMSAFSDRALMTPGAAQARTWLHMIWHCWQDGVPYDPDQHRALQRFIAAQTAAA